MHDMFGVLSANVSFTIHFGKININYIIYFIVYDGKVGRQLVVGSWGFEYPTTY